MVSEILPTQNDEESVKEQFVSFRDWLTTWYGNPTKEEGLSAFWEAAGENELGFGWKEDTHSFMLIFNKR